MEEPPEHVDTQHVAPSAAPHAAPYVAGIDAGGTKTHLRLATAGGDPIADEVRPAGAWTDLDAPGKARLIAGHLRDIAGAAGGPGVLPGALAVGAHGCDSDAECAELRLALHAELGLPVRVVNDAFLLAAAAGGTGPAAGLVVGTGSIAVARDAAGRSLYAGGWGWLIGDGGSAWGTVREAVRALAEAHDRGAGEDDPLLPALLDRSGTRSLREVAGLMQNAPAGTWAGWAPAVFTAAAEGSPAARHAIENGAHALASLVADLVARGARVTRVVAGGGVIVGQDVMADAVAHALRERCGLPLTVFRGLPVTGAVRLARRMLTGDGGPTD
ncbi:N-acetylglucosamine kinase [Streptomyces sp. TS71-3]|uniref:N-acetylglucosamine kinase n=1 Tax=Streptomyces sp. TS71-3 TaxID=2733862 RepID=UPI001BB422B8|nr:BadF/BadG/BcrA/BcrD ATPase family protein [Streptomyces sp. TS71-3]